MPSNWRLKTYLSLFLILFSVYLLIPSLLGFNELREKAEKEGDKPPWYVQLFPNKQINLGLDLRGGIYLELEVSVDEALVHRSEIIVGELERFLKEKNIPYQSIRVLPHTSILAIVLQNSEGLNAVQSHIKDIYGNSLKELEKPPQLVYRLADSSEEARLAKFQEMVQWAKGQKQILDVQLDKGEIYVVLDQKASADEVNQSILSAFGGVLQQAPSMPSLFLAQSEAYQEKLKDETLKQAVETIRNRIDRHGVAEPTIQRLGSNRVVVELPGVRDPDRAIGLVKRAGKLEFKLVDESIPDAKVKELVETARTENKIPEGYTEEIVGQINEALKGKIPADSEVAFEFQYDSGTKKVVGGIPYLLKKKVEVSGEMLKNTQVSVQNNEPYVSLSFNPTGTKLFGDLTSANIGKRLAILLDGSVSKAPVIKSAIPNGEAQITMGYGDYQALLTEAEDLVVVLREGALPATLKVATKTVIGPSLGKNSIERGFHATLLAAAIVITFMALWYKGSGVLADVAVIINVMLIFSCLTLFGATLTLPGVAGIVLTIGMAVDANVIILERIKDELAAGRTVKAAVENGYKNGIRAVVDGHLTTFLSGVVLYQYGTGPVRGFAVTLMIGIATTLFTAVVMTRLAYDYLLTKRHVTKLSI